MIGLIGLGNWGKNILRNLAQMKQLSIACDNDIDKINKYKLQYPEIDFTLNYEDIINNPHIKGVCIALPCRNRLDIFIKAIMSKKTIFVEKPFADNLEDANTLMELIKKYNSNVMVGHILHYHPGILKLKSLIDNNYLGDIQYAYSNRLNNGNIKAEKNVLWCFAPHDISVLRFLLNLEPENIDARGYCLNNRNIIDSAHIFLSFPNNIKSHCFVSWNNPFKEQKTIISGHNATAVFEDSQVKKLTLHLNDENKKQNLNNPTSKTIPFDKGEPLGSELEHFVSCVLNQKSALTSAFEGHKVVEILAKTEKIINFQL